MLKELTVFSEKPPKGFEKYFKPGGKKGDKDVKPETKEAKKSKDKPEPKPEPPKPSTSPGPQGSKPYDQWSFGLFGGTGSR